MVRRHFRSFPALLACIVLGAAAAAFAQEDFASYPPLPPDSRAITVLDCQGQFVGRLMPQKRYWVPLARIPAFLQQSLLAVEDARFYEHGGIDVRGIARAFMRNMSKGKVAEGDPTITQQLIKNKYLTSEKSLDRKVKEARMAMEFETKYTKQQILEMYFNEIYYGNGAWGIAQATRLYFNKTPEELSEAECVVLAGVPKNPGRYNPLGRPADLASRGEVVLSRMVELGLINAARKQSLASHPAVPFGPSHAPYYLAHLKARLLERYGPDILEQGGLDVTAALDMNLQEHAERVVRESLRRLNPGLEGALICLDPATGDVLAAVGGAEGSQDPLNRAFNSRRQPGSSIKPLIYAAALEKGVVASSLWDDTPVAYPGAGGEAWKPLNYGGESFGTLTLRQALAHSSNVVTVKLLESIGVPALVDFSARMGLPLKAQGGLSLALGTDEVTLKDLVQAYTPLASGGDLAEARTILRVYDRRRGTFAETPPAVTRVLDPGVAWITTSMLREVLDYGTAKSLKGFAEAHPAAGKTGTTDAAQDAWFVGYTPRLLTGVWVGFDRPRPGGRGFTGGTVAAPIWERFMARAVLRRPAGDFPRPETLLALAIDPATGKLAGEGCPSRQEAFFLPGTEPRDVCTAHAPQAPAPTPPGPPNP